MQNKIHKHVQSILVPRDHFSTVQQAARHVEYLGFDPNFKKPHVTDNFYRFRQYTPKTGENYRTEHIGADELIVAKGKQAGVLHLQKHRLGENGHGQLNVYKQPHHNIDEIAESHKLSVYHPSHHTQKQQKGPVHNQFYNQPYDMKREFDVTTRHRAEQKQDMMRHVNSQKRQLQDSRSDPYY